MTALTRSQLVENGRLHALREAIVAQLAPHFADVAIVSHPGKIDIADAVARKTFVTPCVAIAVTRAKPEGRLSRADDVTASVAAYVICDTLMIDGRMVYGDELALAVCEALLVALSDDGLTRWELQNIGPAEDAEGAPLFTVKNLTEGTVYYAGTWKQTLYSVASPSFDAEFAL